MSNDSRNMSAFPSLVMYARIPKRGDTTRTKNQPTGYRNSAAISTQVIGDARKYSLTANGLSRKERETMQRIGDKIKISTRETNKTATMIGQIICTASPS